MSIVFDSDYFWIVSATPSGNQEASLPEKNYCRCGHRAWERECRYNSEYNIQSYIWYQSLDKKYLCTSCVHRIHSSIRKCIHCNERPTNGKEVINHSKNTHPK